jgi:iron complex transport system substrate-binding protein
MKQTQNSLKVKPKLSFQVFVLVWIVIAGLSVNDSQADLSHKRIISMSPAITEILFKLGAEDRIAGVTDFCDFPEEAKKLPKLGGILNPNVETMITLRPDLVIHHYDSLKIRDIAIKLDVDYLPVKLTDIDSILDSIEKIGYKIGLAEKAIKLRRKLEDEINLYKNKFNSQKKKSVLLLLGDSNDPMRDLYAAGRTTFLGQLLSLAGGDNILPETFAEYPKISREFIIQKSPEVIIIAGPMAKLTPEQEIEHKKRWSKFSTVRAVKTGNIHYIAEDYILIPGPRLTQLVDQFSQSIYPETKKAKN